MSRPSEIQQSLVEVNDCVLAVIDMQESFLNKYDRAKSQRLVSNLVCLINAAQHVDVPVIAMGEDVSNQGGLNEQIRDALPVGVKIHDKDFFALADNPEIFADLEAKGRNTVVCTGVETDVCVAQSAISLLSKGYKTVVLHDGVASMDEDEETGLRRMRDAGVAVSSVKALYYEWLRSVSASAALSRKAPGLRAMRPPHIAF